MRDRLRKEMVRRGETDRERERKRLTDEVKERQTDMR